MLSEIREVANEGPRRAADSLGEWYARVPTICNPADGPSRMQHLVGSERAELVKPVLPAGVEVTRWLAMG